MELYFDSTLTRVAFRINLTSIEGGLEAAL